MLGRTLRGGVWPTLLCGLGLVATFAAVVGAASAQETAATRSATLTAWPNYKENSVTFVGSIATSSLAADLAELGFVESPTRTPYLDAGRWQLHGTLATAKLVAPDKDGLYHLTIGPLALPRSLALKIRLPFASVMLSREPTPSGAGPDESAPPSITTASVPTFELVGTGEPVALDLPFAPVQKRIDLSITPLAGDVLQGKSSAARVAGTVVFSGLREYAELRRYCEPNPANAQYRVASLLSAIDAPPVSGLEFLTPLPAKDAFIAVRTELVRCHYENGTGDVEASFDGRILPLVRATDPLNDWLLPPVPRAESTAAQRGRIDVMLGEVVLGPGDALTVSVPNAELHELDPPPDQFDYSSSRAARAVYVGPRQIKLLHLAFSPRAELVANQLAAIPRALAQPLEDGARAAFPARRELPAWSFWLLGVIPALLLSMVRARDLGGLVWTRVAWALAWLAASLVLLYGSRGSFGLLALAALALPALALGAGRSVALWLAGGAALVLIVFAQLVDRWAEDLFVFRPTLDLETTPMTPLILLVLGVALAALVLTLVRQPVPAPAAASRCPAADEPVDADAPTAPDTPVDVESVKPVAAREVAESRAWGGVPLVAVLPAVTLALVGLSTFDALQKSPLSIAVLALAAAYLFPRFERARPTLASEVTRLLRLVFRSRVPIVGFLLLVIFAAQHGLRSTTDVLGPLFGVLGPAVAALLLLASIVEGFLAIGLLFVVLYPLLPTSLGYLKALVLAVFLSLLFALGIGADNRLIATFVTLFVSRFIYYLSIPLLLGLFIDIHTSLEQEQRKRIADGKPATSITFREAADLYFKDVRAIASSALTLASIIAPSIYAAVTGTPLVSTYFDVLDQWLRFPG